MYLFLFSCVRNELGVIVVDLTTLRCSADNRLFGGQVGGLRRRPTAKDRKWKFESRRKIKN